MRFVQVNDIASVASELAVALRRRGHEVDLLYPRLYGAGLSPLWKLAVIPARFADWLRLAWRLRRGDYDASSQPQSPVRELTLERRRNVRITFHA